MANDTYLSPNQYPEALRDLQNRKAVVARAKYGAKMAAYQNPEFVRLLAEEQAVQKVHEHVNQVAVEATRQIVEQPVIEANPRELYAKDVEVLDQERRLREARSLANEVHGNG